MDEEFIFSDESAEEQLKPALVWNILVVDDDADVHLATKLTLNNVVIANRKINLIDVHSGGEAKDALNSHKDIHLILLDMVMEESESGLEVARWLREEMGQSGPPVIILRTGQPGLLSNEQIMQNKHINCVLEKTSISRNGLIDLLTRLLQAES